MYKNVCSTLVITAENLKQALNLKEPGEWINEFRYIHTVEHYAAKLVKETKLLILATTRVCLKNMILIKRS